jgi:hypothetical protein
MKKSLTTLHANAIKEIALELYSSLMIPKSKEATIPHKGFTAKMRTYCFLKLLVFCKTDDSGRERVCFKAGKGYERRRTDYRYEWERL